MKAVRGRNSKIRLTHKMENCKREHLLRYKTLFCSMQYGHGSEIYAL